MKIDTKYDKFKHKESHIITSGGGRFEGWLGNYDQTSNTIEMWNGFKRTHIDADKIVSVYAKPRFGIMLFIIGWVVAMLFLVNVVYTQTNNHEYNRSYK